MAVNWLTVAIEDTHILMMENAGRIVVQTG